jgi:hemoglobin
MVIVGPAALGGVDVLAGVRMHVPVSVCPHDGISTKFWAIVSRQSRIEFWHVEPDNLRSILVMTFVLALLLALMPVTAAAEDSLCRRLGGSDAISAVVKSFLMKMRKDDADKLGRFWLHRGTDGVAREEQLIVDFVQSATGCDRLYVGRSMADAHRGMGLSAKDWDRMVDLLRATMTEFSVRQDLQTEVVTLVGSTRSSIVECEADQFGCR